MGQPAYDTATVNKIAADYTDIDAAPTFYGWSWVVEFAADSVLAATEGER
jgi:hypothetical protein